MAGHPAGVYCPRGAARLSRVAADVLARSDRIRRARLSGGRPWSPGRPAIDAATREQIVSARRAGLAYKVVAATFGLSITHVWRICHDAAIRDAAVRVDPTACPTCTARAHDAAASAAPPPRTHDAPWPELVAAALAAREG